MLTAILQLSIVLAYTTSGLTKRYEASKCCHDPNNENFYRFNHTSLDGNNINFDQYKGQIVLAVNVASF